MSTVDDSASNRGLGGRIGGKIAAHVANASLSSRVKGAPIQRAVGAQILNDFFAGTGAELRNTMGPLFAAWGEHADTADELRPLFKFLSRGKGELATMIGYTVAGGLLNQGLGAFISNALEPLTGRLVAGSPNLLLPVADAVQAHARGFDNGIDMRYEVNQQGINNDKFDTLVELARNRASESVILDLVNRGEMSEDFAVAELRRLGYDTGEAGFILATRRLLLTPAALADMTVRGILTEQDAAAVAQQSGLSNEDFHALVLDTGEPPGIQDLLFLNRRGFIDTDRLTHGIRQSRVRDEWIPDVLNLTFTPMSTADAIEGAVQGHLTEDESRAITAQNGLLPEHWQPLYDTAGNPPGVQDMISMYHRGVLTLDELIQGIKESRLKNKYIQKVIDAGVTLPPERTIVSLVSKSALDPTAAMDLLLRRGYSQDIATALLSEAHTTKTQKTRDLTESQLVALYEDQAIDGTQLHDMLASLGYDDSEIGWITTLADLRRLKKFNDAAISRVHSQYVGYKITDTDVTTTLDALGIAPNQRDDLLTLWGIERTVTTKQLTLTQIEAAFKKQVITAQDAYTRMQGIGYAADDAALILATLGVDPSTLT